MITNVFDSTLREKFPFLIRQVAVLSQTLGTTKYSWTPAPNIRYTYDPQYLPALARLLPKLNGVAEVVETPKFPILKFTAGLAVNPKPPKLNPLAVELAVSSPPNPDRRVGKETKNLKGERGKNKEEKEKKARSGLEESAGSFTEVNKDKL